MLWNFVIGPAGAALFAVALIFLTLSTVLRERSVPREGSVDRLITARPVINGIVFAAIVLGLTATAVRMGTMA